MAENVLSKGSLFPPELVTEVMNKVTGHSSLARLSTEKPIPFNGQTEFTFSFDKEIDIVAENGAKSHGGVTIKPVTVVPIKVEYGARVSDEFMIASEEKKIELLKNFVDGFAKKVARGVDIMAFHGINPRTGTASNVIGENHFDNKITQKVIMTSDSNVDEDVETAIALIQANEKDVNGMAMSPTFKSALSKLKTADGKKLYPELAWGSSVGNINGLPVDTNSTVSANGSKDRAIIGDFVNMFKWGFAKQVPMKIIEYGNPDNDTEAGDLAGHNQIYIRAEAYVGWGILDPSAFSMITTE